MAEKQAKKPSGRRAFLNDFKLGNEGDYSYMGKLHRYEGELPYRAEMTRVGAFTGAMAIAIIVILFLPAPALIGYNNFYVVPCLIFELIAVFITVWRTIRLIANGKELRAYVFDKTVKKLPDDGTIAAIASGLSIAANIVYLCLNGFGGKPALSAAVLALNAVIFVSALLLKGSVRSEVWSCELPKGQEEQTGPDEGAVFPEIGPAELQDDPEGRGESPAEGEKADPSA